MGAKAGYALWRDIVYPQTATAEERRETYATFAAEQVNMHRVARIQWGHDYPNSPNPITGAVFYMLKQWTPDLVM